MIDLTKLDDALRYKERSGAKRGGLNSPRTIAEYARVAEQLLNATPAAPILCTSQGKWLQVQAVIKRLKAHGVVEADYDFPIKAEFERREPAAFEEKVLTDEQFARLLEYLPRTEKGRELTLACKIAYYGGLRRNEILALKPNKIDIIPAGAIILNLRGKGGKIRKAYLPQQMRAEIAAFQGFSITANYITHTMRSAILAIRESDRNFPETDFHGLRHSFATHRLKKGANIKELQQILGHSNPMTTMIYLHAVNDVPESMKREGY